MNKEKYQKLLIDKKRFLSEGKEIVFHGVKYEHLENIFSTQQLEPRTYHRYWKDGSRLKENHPDYEDSFWKFGWCLSRDIEIALNFGCVVFVLDRKSILSEFKVEPFAWNFHFSDKYRKETNFKKEREEFVVSLKTDICLRQKENEKKFIEVQILPDMYRIYKEMPKLTKEDKAERKKYKNEINIIEKKLLVNWNKEMNKPHGKNLDLNKHMVGFYINTSIKEIFCEHDSNNKSRDFFQLLEKDPRFLGELYSDRSLEKQMQKKNKP